MKFLVGLLLFVSTPLFSVEEDDIVFELKREEKTEEKTEEEKQIKKKVPIPLRFRRKSFTYNKDFVIYNEKPKSNLRKGTMLRVNIPYRLIASFSEEFPIYGMVISPFTGILSGKTKGVKNTNKAVLSFNEIILEGKAQSIESFPIFLEGDLKESLFQDMALNFFETLPSVLALALGSKIPQSQIHFINTDLKQKVGGLSVLETEKKRRLQYLEIKNPKLFKVVIK